MTTLAVPGFHASFFSLQKLLESLRFESIHINVKPIVNVAPERAQRRDRKTVPGAAR